MKLTFVIILNAMLGCIYNETSDETTTLVVFEDDSIMVSYSYLVSEDTQKEFKILERSELVYYCGEGRRILHLELKNLVKLLSDCLGLTLTNGQPPPANTTPTPNPSISIIYFVTNYIKYEVDYKEGAVAEKTNLIVKSLREKFGKNYEIHVQIMEELEIAFLNYVTNNVDTNKNDFFDRPIISLTSAHFLIVFEAGERNDKGPRNALSDNLLIPERLNLASKVYNCLGMDNFYKIYLSSLILDSNGKPEIIDYCSSTSEFDYEPKISELCLNSELIKKLPTKAKIKGNFNVEKCADTISKLIEQYSLSSHCIKKSDATNVFEEIKKMGKPLKDEFSSMDLFTAYQTKYKDNEQKKFYFTQNCDPTSKNNFQSDFPTNDMRCFAIIYSSKLLELFQKHTTYKYSYSSIANSWAGGVMFLDPAMTTDANQHLKWIIAIVFLTVIALLSVVTMIVILIVEKHKARSLDNQTNSAIFLWSFNAK